MQGHQVTIAYRYLKIINNFRCDIQSKFSEEDKYSLSSVKYTLECVYNGTIELSDIEIGIIVGILHEYGLLCIDHELSVIAEIKKARN